MDKVVLAYSGGLDTSCCIPWIKEKYNVEVICFSAFIGEVSDEKKLRKKAIASGAKKAYIKNLKSEFAKDLMSVCCVLVKFGKVSRLCTGPWTKPVIFSEILTNCMSGRQ